MQENQTEGARLVSKHVKPLVLRISFKKAARLESKISHKVFKGTKEGSVGTADGMGLSSVAAEGFQRQCTTGCFACPARFRRKVRIPGLQPLSTGAGEKPCNINVSETAFEHPGGFNYADTRTFSETDVQMLLSLPNPFKIKKFVG